MAATQTSDVVHNEAARMVSLDVFRGLTIAGMLLVNNPGSWANIYAPLRHAEWHGWTPTDLIFPFFLFIVGTAMTLSFKRMQDRGVTGQGVLLKAARRAALIFAAGLVLHSFPWWGYDYGQLRIPGVLQRIALVYLAASAIYVVVPSTRGRILALATLLYGYWLLQTIVPVPGGFTGVLQPGMDLGAYIDRSVFSEQHLWKAARTWDPEGLLSTIPAIGTTLLGAFAGIWLTSNRSTTTKTTGLVAAGLAGVMAGVAWGWVFPINKNLWTSSYVLFTAGLACLILALCYWLVDVRGHRRWAMPFVVFGMNAIAAFFLSSLGARLLSMIKVGAEDVTLKTFIYRNVFTPWATPHNASLAFAITYVLFWLGIMTVFYRKRVFIKL